MVVGPTGVETDARGLVFPTASVIGDVLEVRVVFEDKTVIGSKRKGVRKAPVAGKDGTALRGVEIDEQVGPLNGGFPIGSVPSEKEHGFVPGHTEVNAVGVRLHQRIAGPIAEIAVDGDVFGRCPLYGGNEKR